MIDPVKKTVKTRDEFFAENLEICDGMFSNYFEDGDNNRVKMIHRLQFVLTSYMDILSVLNAFDMYPSRVAYDGEKVYMTPMAHMAYRYMINIVNERYYSNMFDSRLSKYFSYGFSIIMPELDMKKIQKNKGNYY